MYSDALRQSRWQEVVAIADEHYAPGSFTTFPAYEWTANHNWQNLHRIVLFRDSKHVPDKPLTALDTSIPSELWQWMDEQRAQGMHLLAIPHNSNASDGMMFPVENAKGDIPVDLKYSEQRSRNEPLLELTQIKGTSEVYPSLSPNDEFAGFELWDFTLTPTATAPKHHRGGYAREALIRGLDYEQQGRGNPFKFGFIGDSDGHNASASIEENNYTGKFGFELEAKHRLFGPPGVPEAAIKQIRKFSSGGLAGVWAASNTREAIFDAMLRKETFATSGPRTQLRVFAGFAYTADLLQRADWVEQAYDLGVPMGSELIGAPSNQALTLLVAASKDPQGANLDRAQVIKGWVTEGEQRERIYDVALSDGRTEGTQGVGSTVDLANASYRNDIGATQLMAVWTDPDFDPAQAAVYYVRVLEIPTPRWSTYDAVALGVAPPDDVPVSIQERAWSSPIWYSVDVESTPRSSREE